MTSSNSKIASIQSHFLALSKTASELNTASDELTKVVATLDEALRKLNVGLTVWVTFTSWSTDSPDEYDQEHIGYCKVNGKWGISLRRIWGDQRADDHAVDGPWPFNDGPREMRLRGVDKIPEVIEALAQAAFQTTKQVQEKTEEVRELAAAIKYSDEAPQAKLIENQATSEAAKNWPPAISAKMAEAAMRVAKAALKEGSK